MCSIATKADVMTVRCCACTRIRVSDFDYRSPTDEDAVMEEASTTICIECAEGLYGIPATQYRGWIQQRWNDDASELGSMVLLDDRSVPLKGAA